jgi:hypothetical protein
MSMYPTVPRGHPARTGSPPLGVGWAYRTAAYRAGGETFFCGARSPNVAPESVPRQECCVRAVCLRQLAVLRERGCIAPGRRRLGLPPVYRPTPVAVPHTARYTANTQGWAKLWGTNGLPP